MDYAVFHENQNIQVYSIKKNTWMNLLSVSETRKFINCDTNFSQPNFFVLGVKRSGVFFYDYVTGKCLLKQNQKGIEFCKCNLNGKQIASKASYDHIHISDIVRGHTIKALKYQDENDLSESSIKFEEDLLLYKYGSFIYFLDTISAKTVKKIIYNITPNRAMFSLHPGGGLIAVEKNKNTISFNNLDDSAVFKQSNNYKGLNLEGVIANLSVGLSEENIRLFIVKGEYYPFDEIMIQKLFSNSLSETTNIAEISWASSNLNSIHVKIIEKYIQFNDLKELDLSDNKLLDEWW